MYYFYNYHNINDLNVVDQFGQNAMHIACASNFQELIKFLLDQGKLNLYAQDCNGNTCLHMAAKSGLARICWQITQKHNGECVRLINIANKQNQTPLDIIRNETESNFLLIKQWISLEAKTNDYLIDKSYNFNLNGKKTDMPVSMRRNRMNFFKWNSDTSMRLCWILQLLKLPLIISLPMIINAFLFDKNELSLWQGLIGYSTFVLVTVPIAKLTHRISHISGLQNPFLFGFIVGILFHNYTMFFFSLIESKNRDYIKKLTEKA